MHDEFRTHGGDSAVDDELLTPPAGMGAIPADMPNAEQKPGDMALEYNLQTFNALVAANTAMTTELSLKDSIIARWQAAADGYHARIAELNEVINDLRARVNALASEKRDAKEEARALEESLRAEILYLTSRETELQRKLDRAAGYIDRVVEDEDRDAPAPTSPTPRPPVGPNLFDIPGAMRRTTRAWDGESLMAAGALANFHAPRPRNY